MNLTEEFDGELRKVENSVKARNMKTKEIAPFILVIDEDRELAEAIARQFQQSNMNAVGVSDFRQASQILADHFVNLLLLNPVVNERSGFDFMEQLHRNGQYIPAIFTATQPTREERLRALELGDDILEKPLYLRELLARIRAVLRRSETSRDWHLTENTTLNDGEFEFCGATVSPKTLTIQFPDGVRVGVGKKEIGLMSFFAQMENAIVSRKDIIHRIWGIHANIQSRSLDQYVVRIRHLFRNRGYDISDHLRTIHGVGYLYQGVADENSEDVSSFEQNFQEENGLMEVPIPIADDLEGHPMLVLG